VNRRDQQITAIAERVEGLDRDRLRQFYAEVRNAYATSTIIDTLAKVDPIEDREPSDFHVLSAQEARSIAEFNDPSYAWDMYCGEFGRSVALAEQRYFFDSVFDAAPPAQMATGVGFEGVVEAINAFRADGYNADFLLMPVAHMVGFYNYFGPKQVEFTSGGEQYFDLGSHRVRILSTNIARPLDRFIVMDKSVGTWRVKLDPTTKTRLTVAIGIQTQPRAVMWIAETVARYDITDPKGLRSFHPDEKMDPYFKSMPEGQAGS